MNKRIGIRDLMEAQRFQAKHIAKTMKDYGVPGNWNSIQNIYNLMSGDIIPKDPYVFIALANMLNVELSTILIRYSSISSSVSFKEEPTESLSTNVELDW